jgi:hypothetical protein
MPTGYNLLFSQAGRFYSSGNELSNSLINQVFQDNTGFVWVATENGLNRLDGHNLKKYHAIPGDSSSLKKITSIVYTRTVTVSCGLDASTDYSVTFPAQTVLRKFPFKTGHHVRILIL